MTNSASIGACKESSKCKHVALAIVLAFATQVSAQNTQPNHHQYKLTEVGTFGGPNSISATGPAYSYEKYFNGQGATVGTASTKTSDPFSPNCFYDCFADHALTFQNNTLTDLGAPGLASSLSYGINDSGLVVGVSENGLIDPLTGYPAYHAMVWINGVQGDLGTFGGSVSQAFMVNDRGDVVGVAANAVPDAYATALGSCTSYNCWPVTTEQRAFLWTGGALHDLGTLGGNDAVAYFVNANGQVAGVSYTNTTPNPTTGAPTQMPFLWDQGKMVGLGSLGGTWGVTYSLNNRGQIVGNSNLAGDQYWHGFFWDQGVFTDLGTLGGDISYAAWLNDAGEVVGGSLLPGDATEHAFLYTHAAMTDLGTVAADSFSLAVGINERLQIVGCSGTSGCSRAFLWEGGDMVDLNALVEPPSNLQLLLAYAIADTGEILAYGTLPNGDVRLALLYPDGDCNGHCQSQIAASQMRTSAPQPFPLSPSMKWQPNLLGAPPPRNSPLM